MSLSVGDNMNYAGIGDHKITARCGSSYYGDLLAWAVINRKVFQYNDVENTFTVWI